MKWFKMEEFRCKDGSETPEEAKENICELVKMVLDPARERFGSEIHVNSGYRSEAHNRRCGSKSTSQHRCKNGSAAADICATHERYGNEQAWRKANLEIARAIVKNGRWDQMILYPTLTSSTSDATQDSSSKLGSPSLLPRFVHVSWKRGGLNRHQILRKTAAGYEKVEPSSI